MTPWGTTRNCPVENAWKWYFHTNWHTFLWYTSDLRWDSLQSRNNIVRVLCLSDATPFPRLLTWHTKHCYTRQPLHEQPTSNWHLDCNENFWETETAFSNNKLCNCWLKTSQIVLVFKWRFLIEVEQIKFTLNFTLVYFCHITKMNLWRVLINSFLPTMYFM